MTFGRRIYTPPAPAPLRPLERAPNYASAAGMSTPVPKEPRLENPYLLEMAREVPRPCLLSVPGVCIAGSITVPVACCACHGNSSIYGKGGHKKAHDFFSVWGCHACHTWLDTTAKASGDDRQAAFAIALDRQINEWLIISLEPATTQRDYDAVTWALHHLIERGYGKKQET